MQLAHAWDVSEAVHDANLRESNQLQHSTHSRYWQYRYNKSYSNLKRAQKHPFPIFSNTASFSLVRTAHSVAWPRTCNSSLLTGAAAAKKQDKNSQVSPFTKQWGEQAIKQTVKDKASHQANSWRRHSTG